MLIDLITRTARPSARESTIETRPRVEVCPPSLRPPTALKRVQSWLRELVVQPSPFEAPLPPANARRAAAVRAARDDFARELDDLRGEEADSLRCVISDSQSLRELWHLRSKVFGLVAVQLSQHEAEQRLQRLNSHFPTRSPRSGLSPFDVIAALDKQ